MNADVSDQIEQLAVRDRLSFVGVAKNCGKTTTLTTLLELRARQGATPPALVSVGVDGEARDALLKTDKPSIRVRPGQWVATAEGALRRSTARVEYVESVGISTPLGGVYVCRVRRAGTMMLAGLSRRSDLVRAVRMLDDEGPGPVWIDGAYDRIAAADPEIADGVVVATGAVAGDDLDEVVDQTRHLVSRLGLEEVGPANRRLIQEAIRRERPMIDDGRIRPVPGRSAVTGLGELSSGDDGDIEAIAVPGLVSNRVVEELLSLGDDRRLVVPDATVVQVDDGLWESLVDRWSIRVLEPVAPVAISYNPTSVAGDGLDADAFGRRLREVFDDPMVFDSLPYWPGWV